MAKKEKVLVQTIADSTKYLDWMLEHEMYIVPKSAACFLDGKLDELTHIYAVTPEGTPCFLKIDSVKIADGKTVSKTYKCPVESFAAEKNLYVFRVTPVALPKSTSALVGYDYLLDLSAFVKNDIDKAVLTHSINGCAAETTYREAMKKMFSGRLGDIITKKPEIIGTNLKQLDLFGEGEIPFPPPANPQFRFIDLFAGIGGFRQAMQNCGGKCVFTSEFDAAAQKTYQVNFGEFPFGDITKQETHDKIPENFDIVCAGFPCQAFSLAGKRLGFNDNFKGMSRGTLFAEVVKICEKHQPKAVFCENVKGLAIHDKGNTFKVIKGEFEKINTDVFGQTLPGKHSYRFFHKVLNSKDFGVPQNRERIYMVALRDDYAPDGYEFKFPEPPKTKVSLEKILEKDADVPARYYLSDVYVDTLKKHKARHAAKGNGFGYEIRERDGIAGAIVCGGMGRERNLVQTVNKKTPDGLVPETHIKGKINAEGIRKMTPREWARLQGFPEKFKFVLSDVHLYKQFGNSVSIPVIEAISHAIVERIAKVDAQK